MKIPQPKNEQEAREQAIDWQQWVSEQNKAGEDLTLYSSDLVEWQKHFTETGKKFNLIEEFEENGIL